MPQMTGGCLCGQVRYTADAEPIFAGVCHCKDCQKQSGAAFSVVVAVPQSALSLQGATKSYAIKGDSGKDIIRRFCPNCGSSLFDEPAAMPGATMVCAGTLDDTSWLKPVAEIYCDSKQPWVELGGGLKQFPKMPQPGG